jgi:hypothetical protein
VLSSQVRRARKASTTLAVNLSAIENAALQNIAPGELALWQNKTPKKSAENVLTMCQLCVGSSERKKATVYLVDKEQSRSTHNQPLKTLQLQPKIPI